MNKVILVGRLTKDGEVRTTDADIKLYSSSIAVNRRFKNVDGTYDADFFNFTLWRVSDEFVKYLKKGKQILIEGRIQNRTYDDKDGNKKYVTDVIAERIELLGGNEHKEDTQSTTQTEQLDIPMNTTSNYDEDSDIQLSDSDLPF